MSVPAAQRLLIQMSGAPGAGKSTVAARLAPALGGVVLDLDVVKSALLDSGVDFGRAGMSAYRTIWAQVDFLLARRHTVIVDSPCFHPEVLATGTGLARRHAVPYAYIECRTEDLDVLDRRMRARPALASQRTSLSEPPHSAPPSPIEPAALFRDWIAHMARPEENYLLLDTARDLDACVEEATRFVAHIAAPRGKEPNR